MSEGGPARPWLVVAPLALLVALAWWTIKRGGAYALGDVMVAERAMAVAFGVGLSGGVVLAPRAPDARLAFGSLLAPAVVVPLGNVLAFVVSSHVRDSTWLLVGLAVACGAALGVAPVTFGRWLSRVSWAGPSVAAWLSLRGGVATLASLGLVVALGGRVGALRFPFLLGVGLALVAHAGLSMLRASLAPRVRKAAFGSAVGLAVAAVAVTLVSPLEEATHLPDPVLSGVGTDHSRTSVTSGRGALQVLLDGVLRLSSLDVHRKREAMAHPAMLASSSPRRVLVLGGGDGTATREVLRHPTVERVLVVEPDAGWLALGRTHPVLRAMNGGAFDDHRVETVRRDAMAWLLAPDEVFDVALLDLADPDTPERAKLFTVHAFKLVAARLDARGVLAVVLPSPEAQPRAFASLLASVAEALPVVVPYRAELPTQGVVGFALGSRAPLGALRPVPPGLAYLDGPTLAAMFDLAPDERKAVKVEKNLLFHQVVVRYREEDAP